MENKQITLRQHNGYFYIDSPTEPEWITITKIKDPHHEKYFINAIRRFDKKVNEFYLDSIPKNTKNQIQIIYKTARNYALKMAEENNYEFLDKTEIGKQIAMHIEEILDPIIQKKKPFTLEDMQKLLSNA